MALPTLDATFASSADLPRKQMLAKWLVEETRETGASNVLVSGLTEANGIYTFNFVINDKPSYLLEREEGAYTIRWNGIMWQIGPDGGDSYYYSTEDVEFPWLVETWQEEAPDGNPVPTISEFEIFISNPVSNYYSLPERYLWAKIAVAAGGPKTEADYISLPKNYVWSDIYNAVAGSSGNHTDWSENVALGHIAAAYRGDTGNPANLATYIDWPWRYKVASIIDHLIGNYNAIIVSSAGSTELNGTYTKRGTFNGKPYYNLIGEPNAADQSSIFWAGTTWDINNNITDVMYSSGSIVNFPWEATSWTNINGSNPTPTLTPTNV